MPHLLRALPALVLAAPALAQDLEDRTSDLDESQRLSTDFMFESQWHEYANLDYRPLDESSDQAIMDSDDRNSFAFTGFSAGVGYEIDDRTRFEVGLSHRGLWGNDQLGGTNVFGGWVYVTALNAHYRFGDGDTAPELVVGRQYFSLGGIGGREYILADILDMVRLDVHLGDKGTLVLIPMNVMGLTAANDDAELYRYISQSSTQTYGFRGDHMSRRMGGLLVLDGLTDALDARAYAFYTDIGALGSGSDISYNGLLGNFADNDWVANFGVRGSYEVGAVAPFLSFDLSQGIDRKELVARDVDTNGWAIMAGAVVDTRDDDGRGLKAEATFFRALGAAYDSDGLQYSHGYVGMKAKQVGGTLYNRYLGFHPSGYVGMFGISDSPHDVNRKAGTQVIHAGASYDLGAVEIGAGWWYLADTGVTFLNMDKLNEIDPPYGYSREAFAAEERMGKDLGHELDLDLGVDLSDYVSLGLHGAVILPGSYYAVEVSRIAGDALGGEAMAWAINGGTAVRF